MDDSPAATPLPVVFTEPGMSYVDTALAAVAMEKAAHALDWALRGDAAHDAPHWMHVIRADVLDPPDLEAALKAEGVSGDAARTLALRIGPLAERTPLRPDTPAEQWLGIAGAAGVPESDRPVLLALARLALAAANALAPPGAPGRLVIAPLVDSVTEPATYWDGAGPGAGILATRLGVPDLLEREHLDLLGLGAHALIDGHAGLEDWIPRGSDPTVRVRIPAEHRGVPLAFVPFVVRQQGALDALHDGALFAHVLSHVGRAFNALKDAERRNPQ